MQGVVMSDLSVTGCKRLSSTGEQVDRTGQDRTGQDRTGQDRTGQDRTGQGAMLHFFADFYFYFSFGCYLDGLPSMPAGA
jgi:hypothetical protein